MYLKLSATISVNKAELQMPLKNVQALVSLPPCSPSAYPQGHAAHSRCWLNAPAHSLKHLASSQRLCDVQFNLVCHVISISWRSELSLTFGFLQSCSQPGAGAHQVVQAGGQTSHPDIADSSETFQGHGKPAMKGLKACHVQWQLHYLLPTRHLILSWGIQDSHRIHGEAHGNHVSHNYKNLWEQQELRKGISWAKAFLRDSHLLNTILPGDRWEKDKILSLHSTVLLAPELSSEAYHLSGIDHVVTAGRSSVNLIPSSLDGAGYLGGFSWKTVKGWRSHWWSRVDVDPAVDKILLFSHFFCKGNSLAKGWSLSILYRIDCTVRR